MEPHRKPVVDVFGDYDAAADRARNTMAARPGLDDRDPEDTIPNPDGWLFPDEDWREEPSE